MDHEEDKGAPTMKEAARSAFEAWCAKEYGPRWRLVMRSLCPAVAAWDAWQSASPTGVTADARLPIGDEIRQLCALKDREAITANLLRFGGLNKHHARAVAEVMLRADDFKRRNDERATQCNEGTRSVEAGTSVLEQQERDAHGVKGLTR